MSNQTPVNQEQPAEDTRTISTQADAVREMPLFVRNNRVRLREVSVRKLTHEGHRI